MGIYGNNLNNNTESVNENKVTDAIGSKIKNNKELKDQWKAVADKFVKHKWIYRYINDKQKEQLEKHYAVLCDEKTPYSKYKRSFNAIAKFMGLSNDNIILETITFEKDKEDKDQWKVSVRYSKGRVKVNIPDGVRLIHVSPADNIKELNPSFRSKLTGRFLYPSKRCFFTVAKQIKPKQAALEKTKVTRYTPSSEIKTAYIDPTYSDFGSGSVYIETDSPIPVENFDTMMQRFFKRIESKFGINKKEEGEE